MAEPLTGRSALLGSPTVTSAGTPGVTLRERTGLTLASVAAFRGREAELAETIRASYGIELPTTPKRAAAGETAFVWAGPGKWLATLSGAADFRALPAAVADQSGGRTLLTLSGPRARETLATLIAIDLHRRVFGPGDVALTHAASIAVHLWQLDDEPTYEIAVFRSYAATLWRWLVQAGRARDIDARLD